MLSNNPAIFQSEMIAFKEYSELTSLEQVMLAKFLFNAHEDPLNIFPWGDTPEDVLLAFSKTLKDENVWIIYFKSTIVGFWCIADTDNQATVYSYLSPVHQKGDFDLFCLGFFKTLSTKLTKPIFFYTGVLSPERQEMYFGKTSTALLTHCEELLFGSPAETFDNLFEHIKPYYS